MSFFKMSVCPFTRPIAATDCCTVAAPFLACCMVLSACRLASEAFWAISTTEAFICLMATAASAVRTCKVFMPLLVCSTTVESSAAAVETSPAMDPACSAVSQIILFEVSSFSSCSRSSVRTVNWTKQPINAAAGSYMGVASSFMKNALPFAS